MSQQVKALEGVLGASLFRRLPRGLVLTDEGKSLLPALTDAFDRIGAALEKVGHVKAHEVLTVGCVGTFATGWLLGNLDSFRSQHPNVDLRVETNNNRVDLAGEGLDLALRFGDGSWHGTEAVHLMTVPLAPVCTPRVAARLRTPADLSRETLLRSYRSDEWALWFAEADVPCPAIHGPLFDSSVIMVEAAAQGLGIALVPIPMFERALSVGRLIRPFNISIQTGSYWLTWLQSKPLTETGLRFKDWICKHIHSTAEKHICSHKIFP